MGARLVNGVTGLILCAFPLSWSDVGAQTAAPGTSINALKKLSVEQLTDVDVTSVSRATERLGGAPAAVTVVTNEDIRRSGATSVPEALRLVPGIHVARQTSNTWAVSSRGFSSVMSEKLLVLSDTRSVYTPLVSGVFWDVHDYLLQDVDRIEVIRGPGATLWGSNALNGVDLRLAWRGWQQIEISAVGQNLLHRHHPEFGAPAQRGEIERGIYAKVAWGF